MLGFFTFSMQGIILADNLLVLFVFWELVGFSSYMLIGHWMEKPEAAQAAKKAFIINRIGDAGFVIGLMIIWTNTGTFNLTEIIQAGRIYEWQTAASLCIFCGVIGKSAQFPLFTWLPDAMEGPTPVSALIHAATMVAAGVYLMIRVFPLFTADSLMIVGSIGMITALIGAVSALSQHDLKKILAYSTVSQLGLMITVIGMGAPNVALLHLLTHAFFKCCLFLSAGSVIHALHLAQGRSDQHYDAQDIRNMGGLRNKLPVTFMAFLISGSSLAGIPFFSGFLSKEAILSEAWLPQDIFSWIVLMVISTVSFLTVLYTFRLIWFIFMTQARKTQSLAIVEAPAVMRLPIVLLAFCSLWFVVSWNPFNFNGWLLPENDNYTSLGLTLFSIGLSVTALVIGYLIFGSNRFAVSKIFHNSFYLDVLYQKLFGRLLHSSTQITLYTDKYLIDRFIHGSAYAQVMLAYFTGWIDRVAIDGTVNGFGRLASSIGSMTRSFQGGKIQLYIFWSIFAIIIFLIWTIN